MKLIRSFLFLLLLFFVSIQENTETSKLGRGANGIAMMYDVASPDSFDHINDWLKEVNW